MLLCDVKGHTVLSPAPPVRPWFFLLRADTLFLSPLEHESNSAKVRRSGSRRVAELHVFYSHLNVKVCHSSFLGSEHTCRNKTVKINSGSNQETQQQRLRESSESTACCCCPLVPNTPSCATAQRIQPGVDHELIANDGVIKERFADL